MTEKNNKSNIVIVITTIEDEAQAKNLSIKLLELRLVACISFREICSSYWWDKKINTTKEFEMLLKTNSINIENLLKKLIELHPYKEPEIIYFPVDTSEGYSSWINKTCF